MSNNSYIRLGVMFLLHFIAMYILMYAMVNDLPVMLHTGYGHVPYGQEPRLLLYFLDGNAWLPEGDRIWVAGRAGTEIVVRAPIGLSRLHLSLASLVPNTVELSAGGDEKTMELRPGVPVQVTLEPRPSYCEEGSCTVLSIATSAGLEPRRAIAGSTDSRFLGVELRLRAELR